MARWWLALVSLTGVACGARSAPRAVPDGWPEGEGEAEAEAESEGGVESESEGEGESEEEICAGAIAHFCDCCGEDAPPPCANPELLAGFCLDEPMCRSFCLDPGADMAPCASLEPFCTGGDGPGCVGACVAALDHIDECCGWGLSESEMLSMAMECCASPDCDPADCEFALSWTCDEVYEEGICDAL